jgi:hypothetical protein
MSKPRYLFGCALLLAASATWAGSTAYRFRVPVYGVPAPAALRAPSAYAITSAYATPRAAVNFEGLYPNETLEIWFKTRSYGALFSATNTPFDGEGPTSWDPYIYVGTDGLLRGEAWFGGGAAGAITCPSKINDGFWHFAALSISGSGQTLYLDGAICGSLTQAPTAQGSGYDYIGGGFPYNWPGMVGVGWGVFQGDWYGATVWSVTRSDRQVAADSRGIDSAALGLVAYYPTNEGGGSILKDASPNENTAILSAPNWVTR